MVLGTTYYYVILTVLLKGSGFCPVISDGFGREPDFTGLL